MKEVDGGAKYEKRKLESMKRREVQDYMTMFLKKLKEAKRMNELGLPVHKFIDVRKTVMN